MGGDLGDVGEDGTEEGGRDGVEGENGGGDSGKGVGGMVVSIALETQFCLVVMASDIMKSSGSTWVSSSSLMNWYSLSQNILDHTVELKSGRSSTLVVTVVNQSSKTT